jgi:hypothetical protein
MWYKVVDNSNEEHSIYATSRQGFDNYLRKHKEYTEIKA